MDPYIGKCILGQFWITEEIGKGGMGAVYKASQPDMDRIVAVKILHTRLAARQDLVLRFRREARAMSKLTHPNTVRVFLFGQLDNGALYIVMEYLDGKNLLQVEKSTGPFVPERAARIMIQVCGALEEAHSVGIIHRDLKPENIVLTNQGGIEDFPKVLDFGLAKMNDPDPSTGSLRVLTQQGAIFGTPEFMSPEQAKGEPLDPRSDIYSLGTILYEMLTCRLPFNAKNPMDFIAHHIKAQPIPVHERGTGIGLTEAHWKTLEKALRKEKEERYQSAGEFAESLKKWLNGQQKSELIASETLELKTTAVMEKKNVQQEVDTREIEHKIATPLQKTNKEEEKSGRKTAVTIAVIIALFILAVLLALFLF